MTFQNKLSSPVVILPAGESLGVLIMGAKSSLWLRTAYVILGQMVGYPNPRLFHLESHFFDLLDEKLWPAS